MTGVEVQAIAGRIEKQDSEWKLNQRRSEYDHCVVAKCGTKKRPAEPFFPIWMLLCTFLRHQTALAEAIDSSLRVAQHFHPSPFIVISIFPRGFISSACRDFYVSTGRK
jgi:hypothetical protein